MILRSWIMSDLEVQKAYLQCDDDLRCHHHSVSILSNSVANLGQTWGSFIMAISSLQSASKLWHVKFWSIFSIAHRSASTSECKADSRRMLFFVPKSWTIPKLSIHTHPYPLNSDVDVHDPYIMHILPKLKSWGSSILEFCSFGGTISFALNQTWHSLSA